MSADDTPSGGDSTPEPVAPDCVQDWPELRDLIGRARAGSVDARNELIESVREYLLLIANREFDRELQAKVGPSDLVQSALFQAEQNLDGFRGESGAQLLAWLKQILRNEMAMAHRAYLQSEKRDVRREVTTTPDSRTVLPLADAAHTPGTEASMHEEALAVREAMARLSPDYRTAIVLRNWERLSFEEIGERMDRTPNAAKKLWARAVQQLEKELKHPTQP